MDIADAYPKFEQRQFYWIDPFNDKASEFNIMQSNRIGKRNINIMSLEDFYLALKSTFEAPKKGNFSHKDAKIVQPKLPISWRNLVKTSLKAILCYQRTSKSS